MVRRSQRDKNLEEAKARRRAAQKKVYRLEHQGIRVRKAEIAPIIPLSELESMNARQLRAHIIELNRFTSRETSFVKGFNGEPLRRQDVQQLHNLELQAKTTFENMELKIAQMPELPGQNQTPWERSQMLSRSSRTGIAGRILEQALHNAQFITSQGALEKLIANAKLKASRDYLPKAVDRRMNSIESLLSGAGYADIIRDVRKLSPEQQLVLMEFTTFAEVARDRFGSGEDGRARVERMDRDYGLRNGTNRADDIRGDLQEILQYVRENTVDLSSARTITNRSTPTKSSRRRR